MTIKLYSKLALLMIALCGIIQTPVLSMEIEEVFLVPSPNKVQSKEYIAGKEFVDQGFNDFLMKAQECNKVFDFGQGKGREFFYLDPNMTISEEFICKLRGIIDQHSLLIKPNGFLVEMLLMYHQYQHLSREHIEKLENCFGSAYVNFKYVKEHIDSQLSSQPDKDVRDYKKYLIELIAELDRNICLVETVFREIQANYIWEYGYHSKSCRHISIEKQVLGVKHHLSVYGPSRS